jgi:acyl-CoA dehydrogenase family protein 10
VADLRPEVQRIHAAVTAFVRERVLPVEQEIRDFNALEQWVVHPRVEGLKAEARAAGLWNLFLPLETDPGGELGAGLTNLEYAHLCEVTDLLILLILLILLLLLILLILLGDGALTVRPGGV